MSSNSKNIKFTLYNIVDTHSQTQKTSMFDCVCDALRNDRKVASSRIKTLNEFAEDCDKDILSFLEMREGLACGLMLRIAPSSKAGSIPNELLSREKFDIKDLVSSENAGHILIKRHYIAFSDAHFVVAEGRNSEVRDIAIYFNWLIKDRRGASLFEFSPVIRFPKDVSVADVSSIEIGAGNEESPSEVVASNSKEIKEYILSAKDAIMSMCGLDTNLKDLVSAKITLTFKPHKRITELQSMMEKKMKIATDCSDFKVKTKRGGVIKGEQVVVSSTVPIHVSSTGDINDGHLFEEMEKFLRREGRDA